MDIHPPPTIIEVDLRPDYDVFVPLVSRLVAEVNSSSPFIPPPPPPPAEEVAAGQHAANQREHAGAGHQPQKAPTGQHHHHHHQLPILLIGGTPISVGDVDLVRRMLESGKLKEMILDSGAIIRDKKKKKGKGRR